MCKKYEYMKINANFIIYAINSNFKLGIIYDNKMYHYRINISHFEPFVKI